MNKKDLKLLMFVTFRYDPSRRIYLPPFIKEGWKRFIEEINYEDYLGDSCDIQKWNEFTDFCKNKTKEINN